jgi:mRNA (2'-O-methyladenosine-N6-)-methyltransferase
VINAKYRLALSMMEDWGYKLVDDIVWAKQTVNGKIAKGHGYYLQHAKETCLVGLKGNVKDKGQFNVMCDVIFS